MKEIICFIYFVFTASINGTLFALLFLLYNKAKQSSFKFKNKLP